ncbi:hypothetical protein SPLC1_S360970 [Arthrospira platensis C1]|nr:hypothetical protein SPLC1_S360970 [Arthrospira platensis C1]
MGLGAGLAIWSLGNLIDCGTRPYGINASFCEMIKTQIST